MSEITKKMLAQALRTKMAQKPFDKITIKELVDACGVNRQTFYYHFPDIYGLLRWSLQQDARHFLNKYTSVTVWQAGVMDLLCYIRQNRAVCLCALNSLARDELERFVYHEVHRLVLASMQELGSDFHLSVVDRDFIARFYALSLCALVLHWVKHGMKESPELLIEKLSLTIHGNLRAAMERFAAQN